MVVMEEGDRTEVAVALVGPPPQEGERAAVAVGAAAGVAVGVAMDELVVGWVAPPLLSNQALGLRLAPF